MKKILIVVAVLIILGGGYFLFNKSDEIKNTPENTEQVAEENKYEFDIEKISGNWISVDDSEFSRKFNSDLTFSDSYGEDGVVSSGIWFVFNKDNAPENFPYTMESGKDYLVINDTNTTLSFVISEITDSSLTLIYLEGGSVLKFNKAS